MDKSGYKSSDYQKSRRIPKPKANYWGALCILVSTFALVAAVLGSLCFSLGEEDHRLFHKRDNEEVESVSFAASARKAGAYIADKPLHTKNTGRHSLAVNASPFLGSFEGEGELDGPDESLDSDSSLPLDASESTSKTEESNAMPSFDCSEKEESIEKEVPSNSMFEHSSNTSQESSNLWPSEYDELDITEPGYSEFSHANVISSEPLPESNGVEAGSDDDDSDYSVLNTELSRNEQETESHAVAVWLAIGIVAVALFIVATFWIIRMKKRNA